MKNRSINTKLALVLLAVFIVVAMKPMWQKAWIHMSGAVIPFSSHILSSTDNHNLLLSVGGERWVSWERLEQAMAYYALVVPPRVELREDGSTSRNDGVSHTDTLKWLCLGEGGGNYQAAEAKSLTIIYDAITQRITIGSENYRLAKGNIFVVRLDAEWRPHVRQIEATLDKATEPEEVVAFFKRVLPDDEEVRKLH